MLLVVNQLIVNQLIPNHQRVLVFRAPSSLHLAGLIGMKRKLITASYAAGCCATTF